MGTPNKIGVGPNRVPSAVFTYIRNELKSVLAFLPARLISGLDLSSATPLSLARDLGHRMSPVELEKVSAAIPQAMDRLTRLNSTDRVFVGVGGDQGVSVKALIGYLEKSAEVVAILQGRNPASARSGSAVAVESKTALIGSTGQLTEALRTGLRSENPKVLAGAWRAFSQAEPVTQRNVMEVLNGLEQVAIFDRLGRLTGQTSAGVEQELMVSRLSSADLMRLGDVLSLRKPSQIDNLVKALNPRGEVDAIENAVKNGKPVDMQTVTPDQARTLFWRGYFENRLVGLISGLGEKGAAVLAQVLDTTGRVELVRAAVKVTPNQAARQTIQALGEVLSAEEATTLVKQLTNVENAVAVVTELDPGKAVVVLSNLDEAQRTVIMRNFSPEQISDVAARFSRDVYSGSAAVKIGDQNHVVTVEASRARSNASEAAQFYALLSTEQKPIFIHNLGAKVLSHALTYLDGHLGELRGMLSNSPVQMQQLVNELLGNAGLAGIDRFAALMRAAISVPEDPELAQSAKLLDESSRNQFIEVALSFIDSRGRAGLPELIARMEPELVGYFKTLTFTEIEGFFRNQFFMRALILDAAEPEEQLSLVRQLSFEDLKGWMQHLTAGQAERPLLKMSTEVLEAIYNMLAAEEALQAKIREEFQARKYAPYLAAQKGRKKVEKRVGLFAALFDWLRGAPEVEPASSY